jgi:hypothetical protein
MMLSLSASISTRDEVFGTDNAVEDRFPRSAENLSAARIFFACPSPKPHPPLVSMTWENWI